MIRIFAVLAALVCAIPAVAQPLPAGLYKQNAIVIDTTQGRIVVKLRTDLAPKHAERHEAARARQVSTTTCRSIASSPASWRRPATARTRTAPAARNIRTCRPSSPACRSSAASSAWRARRRTTTPPIQPFFIMFADGAFLNGKYTVVGEVVSGMDVVDKLKKGEPPAGPDKMTKVQVAADIKG